jgi:hypothetical protein
MGYEAIDQMMATSIPTQPPHDSLETIMSSSRIAVALAVFCLTWATTVTVEAGQNGVGKNISSIHLLANESVQQELGLNETQKAKVAQLKATLQKEMQSVAMGEQSGRGSGLPGGAVADEEAGDLVTRMKMRMKKLDRHAQSVLQTLLSPRQQERLTQLSLQSRGTNALSDPEVVRQLQLTPEQLKRLAKIQSVTSEQRVVLFKSFKDIPDTERARRLAALRQKEAQLQNAVLTDQQRAVFQRMMGAKLQTKTSPISPERNAS